MSTPLLWKAAHLHEKLFFFLYRHPISYNPATNRWSMESNWRRLIPFYISSFGIVYGLGVNSCLWLILKYLVYHPPNLPGVPVIFGAALGLVGLMVTFFTCSALLFGWEVIPYTKILFDYEVHLKRVRIGGSWNWRRKELPHHLLLKQEVRRILRGDPHSDKLGVMLHLTVFYLAQLGVALPFVGVTFRLDPFGYILEDLSIPPRIGKESINPVFYGVNLFLASVCCLEATRTLSLVIILWMIHCQVYSHCIMQIWQMPLRWRTLLEYEKLHIIQRQAEAMIKLFIMILMAGGFILCVMCNCFTFIGWQAFPLSLYVCMTPVTFLIYFVINQTLPMYVNCHEYSLALIRVKWHRKILGEKEGQPRRHLAGNGWLRSKLRCQKPVSFKSGELAVLTRETKVSYYTHITNYTANVFLLFKSALKTLDTGDG